MPIPRDEAPLLVTVHLDEPSFAVLDELRELHFPPALNVVPAHICLFHNLPGAALRDIDAAIVRACANEAPFELRPNGVFSLGRGVAIRYESDALSRLRAALAGDFAPWLTAQDRQRFRPHVTIQNKVEAARARDLLASLAGYPMPVCRVEGVTLWRYRGGPWERVWTRPLGQAQ